MLKHERTAWSDISQINPAGIPSVHWEWLQFTGSLTQRLHHCLLNQIEFRLRNVGWSHVTEDERQVLNLSAGKHWVREIEWRYQSCRWIVARTVIPRTSSSRQFQQLFTIGDASIGTVLFRSDDFTHDPIQVAECSPEHVYHQIANTDRCLDHQSLWARRRIFYCKNDKLLVTELFLPTFFAHPFERENVY
jgi:chorismate lyase